MRLTPSLKVSSGEDYNAIACQEAITKTLAPAYMKKKVQEESKDLSSEKRPDMGGNAVSPHIYTTVFFQLWTEEEEEAEGGLRLQPQGLQQQRPSS